MSKSLPYDNLEVSDQMLSADQILTRWKEDRRDISRSINLCDVEHLWEGLTPKGEGCPCKITGTSSVKDTCLGCSIVSRLFKNGDIIPGKNTTIKVGKEIGKQYRVIIYKVNRFRPKNYSIIHYSKETIEKFNIHENTCFFECNDDYIQHYAVVSSIIEYEMNKVNIPCIPTFSWLWKCEDNIGVVEASPNLGNGTFSEIIKNSEFMETPRSPVARRTATLPLKVEVGRGLLFQLVISLHFLSSYSFIHGSPSVRSLAFSRNPTDFIYQGITVSSPLTLHFLPSHLSSISMLIRGTDRIIRIFHSGCYSLIKDKYKFPELKSCIFSGEIKGIKIDDNYNVFNYYMKFSGLPIFHKVLDLYLFLTVLMYEESFQQYTYNDEPVYTLIKNLFSSDDYKKYLDNIELLRKKLNGKNLDPTADDFLYIISNITLRCDAIDYFWGLLSQIK